MAQTNESTAPSAYVYVCAEELDVAGLEQDLVIKRVRYQKILRDALPISSRREDRQVFLQLMRSMRAGDRLYVPSLGSLGPTLRDVLHSIWSFKKQGVSLYCMQLSPVDLTSSESREIIATLSCALEICDGIPTGLAES